MVHCPISYTNGPVFLFVTVGIANNREFYSLKITLKGRPVHLEWCGAATLYSLSIPLHYHIESKVYTNRLPETVKCYYGPMHDDSWFMIWPHELSSSLYPIHLIAH